MNNHGTNDPKHLRSPISLDIIVVGAGLSGLAAAVSCLLSGHKVTIFESASALQEVSRENGANIWFTSSNVS
jgi:2-polyprenyl-6-methoxyphenol hydroxylase-like FAD-dependent oxidoreductase